MTPKEKAKELYYKYYQIVADCGYTEEKAKECALIAVDFAMNSKYSFQQMHCGCASGKLYYEEVKQKIEKL
jgi:hypothetical protein